MSRRTDEEVESFLDNLRELVADCEDLAYLPDKQKGSHFFEDVKDKVADMTENIEQHNNYTDRQYAAYEGWRRGIDQWMD